MLQVGIIATCFGRVKQVDAQLLRGEEDDNVTKKIYIHDDNAEHKFEIFIEERGP
jgi:hypothetical protein